MRCLSNNFNVCSNSFAFFAINEVVASISAEKEEEESSAVVLASSRFSSFSSALPEEESSATVLASRFSSFPRSDIDEFEFKFITSVNEDFKKENARTNEQEEKENRKHAKRSFTRRVLVVLLLL